MTLSRRNFLSGLIAAPAIVKIESLMPVKATGLILPADGTPLRIGLSIRGTLYNEEWLREQLLPSLIKMQEDAFLFGVGINKITESSIENIDPLTFRGLHGLDND